MEHYNNMNIFSVFLQHECIDGEENSHLKTRFRGTLLPTSVDKEMFSIPLRRITEFTEIVWYILYLQVRIFFSIIIKPE